jgi:hypothetical protein
MDPTQPRQKVTDEEGNHNKHFLAATMPVGVGKEPSVPSTTVEDSSDKVEEGGKGAIEEAGATVSTSMEPNNSLKASNEKVEEAIIKSTKSTK